MRTKIRKILGKIRIIDRNLRKVELSPIRDCEAGYAPAEVKIRPTFRLIPSKIGESGQNWKILADQSLKKLLEREIWF